MRETNCGLKKGVRLVTKAHYRGYSKVVPRVRSIGLVYIDRAYSHPRFEADSFVEQVARIDSVQILPRDVDLERHGQSLDAFGTSRQSHWAAPSAAIRHHRCFTRGSQGRGSTGRYLSLTIVAPS
jgi:hypothetical protein